MITKNQTNNHLSKRLYEMWPHFYHIKCGLKQMLHLPRRYLRNNFLMRHHHVHYHQKKDDTALKNYEMAL